MPENMLRRGEVWYVRVRVRGKDVWRSTGHSDVRGARDERERILRALSGEEDYKPIPTFGEWWRVYERTYLARQAASTRGVMPSILKPALDAWGERMIDSITKSDVVGYLNERAKVIRPSTLRNEQQKLHTVFQAAVEEGFLDTNPFGGVEKPPLATRTRVLTPAEQRRLLAVMTPEDGRWLRFMLGTGLRVGDQIERVRDGYVEVLGKGAKRRKVPLLEGVPEPVGLPKRTPREWRRQLAAACRAARVKPLTPHVLRHTFATRYLAGGGDIYILSKILGHASVTITEKVYAHLQEEDLAARSVGIDLGVVAEEVAEHAQVA